MNSKQIAGIVIFVLGVGMLVGSHYIAGQVQEGNRQISAGQDKIDATNKLFSITPVTKPVGKGLTSSGQREVNAGRETADYYQQVSEWLRIGGIAGLIIGVGAFLFSRSKKSA
jgi:hypothetical protein